MEYTMTPRLHLFFIGIFIISACALEFKLFVANMCAITENDSIKTDISYPECLKHYKTKSGCTAVSYIPTASLCRLHFGVTVTVSCPGYVHSQKVSWEQDDSVSCSCLFGQQCQENGGCVLSECSQLGDPDHGQIFGTLFSVGDKVSFMCNPGYLLQGTSKRVCASNGTWSGSNATCIEDPDCTEYLVSGSSDGVDDSQLSVSSYYCESRLNWCANYPLYGFSAIYGRINSTGYFTGSWSSNIADLYQYIQVDFLSPRIISGIALQGRDPVTWLQFVTEFKVLYSMDCAEFIIITDADGDQMRFEGSSNPTEIVIRPLPERIKARCVRVNPTAWVGYISLRFDVLGCRVC